ncbi:MAG: (Fe-S)-binding protein [Helicobacter sp.]|nr:(Fe-S)-binding protein [Helicobacter sp.]
MQNNIYFYATCVGSVSYSRACADAIKILQQSGANVIFKSAQTCCGQPSYNSGYFEESKNVALYNMDLFDKPYPIVVASGSCAGMMKHDYPELFHGTQHYERACEFAGRVYEVAEYLDLVLGAKFEDRGEPVRVTWHSNCHALRVAKCIPSCKRIIAQLSNVTLLELDGEEECCGFGGTFAVKEPGISQKMVNSKIDDIKNKNIEYLITNDGGCLLNISGAMDKMNVGVKSMHFYEFLARRIGLDADA